MSTIDLNRLPAPRVIEDIDYESLLEERRQYLRDALPDFELRETDPLIKLLEENAYREMIWRQRVNEAAQATMLAFAAGSDLEQVAARYNVERLVIEPGDAEAVPPVPPVLESDQRLRERAQMAFEGLSVAGPRDAYRYHALSADGRVSDASAISPTPAAVTVSVLSTDGDGTADGELLGIVEAALSAENVRPVGDRVTVQSATIVNYSVDADLYLYPGPESPLILQAAKDRLQAYIDDQRRLGRDIRRSAIYAALHADGVQRVELTAPAADVVLDDTEAAWCTAVSVSIGGYDA